MSRSLIAAALLTATACQATVYELPAPPPAEERRSVSLIPGEEQRRAEQLYLDARARVLEIFNLLSTKRYAEATEMMSAETKAFLQSLSGGASVEEMLASGKMQMPSGKVAEFDPVTILLAEDVSKLSDNVEGVEEHETNRRKEIFATLPSGELQKIVLIEEGGQWVLHRTRIPEPFDPPGK